MNRNLFKLPFREHNIPDWQCPTCNVGTLRIKKGSFIIEEDSLSLNAHSHEAWEPEWESFVYSCMLECTNNKCKESVANCGTAFLKGEVVQDDDSPPYLGYIKYFQPQYFVPHLNIISIPNKCPQSVSLPLRESFKVFYLSSSSSSNNIRIAIESLLTELGVKKFNATKGKRRLITLHQRIELLPIKYNQFKEYLLAIKWLGNAGSHELGEVTIDDVMDAYEMISHVLEEIYESKTNKLKAMAKKINKKKGPVKKNV